MATQATSVEELKKAEREALEKSLQAKVDAVNAARSGKGTRQFFGFTRGRATTQIFYEKFDESKPETLPTDLTDFMNVTKITDEKVIMGYLIDGYNLAQYTAASDPIADFVDASWDDDKQLQFRTVVRNFSKMLNLNIEEAANKVLAQMKG